MRNAVPLHGADAAVLLAVPVPEPLVFVPDADELTWLLAVVGAVIEGVGVGVVEGVSAALGLPPPPGRSTQIVTSSNTAAAATSSRRRRQ